MVRLINLTNKTSVSSTKIWADGDNQDGLRPNSIIVNLYADGTLTATKTVTEAEGWAYSFTGLLKYKAGSVITYTVDETAIEGYIKEVSGYNITNLRAINVPGTVVWNNDHSSTRPSSVTITLYKNGTVYKTVVVTTNDEGNRSFNFTDLPKCENGTEITYTVTQNNLSSYTTVVNESIVNGVKTFRIVNTYVPPKSPTTTETVTKTAARQVKVTCTDEGKVWDEAKGMCVVSKKTSYKVPRTATSTTNYGFISIITLAATALFYNLRNR